MIPTPMQSAWRSVHEYFQRGGSPMVILYVFAWGAALILLLFLVHRFQQRHSRQPIDQPKRLFRSVLTRLELSVQQRDLLRRMARDLELEHPTALLLCPKTFRRQAALWSDPIDDEPDDEQPARLPPVAEFESLGEALFGDSLPAPVMPTDQRPTET